MEFIFSSRLEKGRLRSRLLAAHTSAMQVTKHVQVAAAYASRTDHPILVDCTREKIRCEVWSRHDHSLATTVPVLEWAFKQQRANGNFTWRLLGSFYHPKIFWWHGYGVYVGSANLSEAAWFSNCEAGTLLLEADLDEAGLRQPLIDFFADVNAQSKPITEQLIKDANALLQDENEMEAIRQRMKKRFKESSSGAQFPQEGLASVQTGISARDQRKTKFLEEWDTTLGYLKIVGDRLNTAGLPDWAPRDVSPGLHTDQFLHAYYYEKVRQNRNYPVEEFHERNRSNPEVALATAIAWWRATPHAPSSESMVFEQWAPIHRELLTPERLAIMSSKDFVRVTRCVHSINNHAKHQRREDYLDDDDQPTTTTDAKCDVFCEDLYHRTNGYGWNPPRLLQYLFFDGDLDQVPERLFDCLEAPYHIPGLKISSLGELIGCALPDIYPPRNDRTNKALRALGWNVIVHSPNQEAG
ncbi:MAG: phospholipase D family protein [Verrucomicrobia bacterium]|nr:phospholipase D family protein [Verrucomicrobiota bacterium]